MISYFYVKKFELYKNSQEDCYWAINKYALNIDIYTIEVQRWYQQNDCNQANTKSINSQF